MIEQLTNHLWQSTIFALAVTLLIQVFRQNRASVRYLLWLSASVKFLVPFALLITLGRQFEWAPVRATVPSTLSTTVVQISEPFDADSVTKLPQQPAITSADSIRRLLLVVWVLGCVTITFVRLGAWRRIRSMVNASTPLELPNVGITSQVGVRSTPGLVEPGVVGWRRPTLLLPEGLERHLTPSQLKAVVAHEMTHVQRRDNVTAAIHMVSETLFWFHPFVWWIGARLVDERERACDEEVLRLFEDPEAYATGILAVCKRYVETPLACISGVSGSNIKKRIEAIMSNHIGVRLTFAGKTVIGFAALFALALPIMVGVMAAATQPPQAPTAQFEVASIRQCDPDNLPPTPAGARGGGANSFQMTPGRAHALCMTVATLIRTAYGYGPVDLEFLNIIGPGRGLNMNAVYGLGVEDGRRVRGGPDWVRSERYSIEATTEGPADAAAMSGPLLRALLERRFQLKAHIESEQVPAFALTVAKGGLKLKPAEPDSCVPRPAARGVPPATRPATFQDVRRGQKPSCGLYGQRNGPNSVFVGGEATLAALNTVLGSRLGVRVLDKTGITDKFNFVLEFAIDENTPGPAFEASLPPPPQEPSDIPPAATIFAAIEQQLGLRLEPARAPREFIVIDRVERPSQN